MKKVISLVLVIVMLSSTFAGLQLISSASSFTCSISECGSQSVRINISYDHNIVGYYWGTSSTCTNNQYFSITPTTNYSTTKTISGAGTYYLRAKDVSNYLSNTATISYVKVTLNANGGTVSTSSVIIKLGSSYTFPVPTRNGYIYKGWSTSPSASTGSMSVSPTASTTYYAVWKKDVETVKPTCQISSTTNFSTSQTATLTMADNKALAGYYWGNNSLYTSNTYASVSGTSKTVTKSITAPGTYYLTVKDADGNVSSTTSKKYCKVIFDANGGVSNQNYIIRESGTVTPPEPTRSGYDFCGWATSSSASSGNITVSFSSDKTFYAVWKKDTTKPTCQIISTSNLSSSQTVTLNISDNKELAGYYWGTNSSYSSNTYTSVSGTNRSINKTINSSGKYFLTAKDIMGNVSSTVTIQFYKAVFNANGGKLNSGDIIVFQGASSFTPQEPTRDKYDFCGWATTSSASSGSKTISLTSDKTYYAVWEHSDKIKPKCQITSTTNFTQTQRVKLEMSDNESVCGFYFGKNSYYASNSYYQITKPWSKSYITYETISSPGTYYLNVRDEAGNLSETVSIKFNKITFNANGGKETSNIIIENNISVTPPVPTRRGFNFIGWSINRNDTKGDLSVSSSGDTTYYAIWNQVSDGIFTYTDLSKKTITSCLSKEKYITIPNTVESIIDNAFYDCSSVISVTVPNSLIDIDKLAFNGVKAILYNGLATGSPWGALNHYQHYDECFAYDDLNKERISLCVSNHGDILVPNSVKSIDSSAFNDCSSLTSITIPATVTSLEQGTFSGLSNCKKIIILGKTTSIKNVINNLPKGAQLYVCRDSAAETVAQLNNVPVQYIDENCADTGNHILSEQKYLHKAATCTETGEYYYDCLICGKVAKTEVIPALGHQYKSAVTTTPTCTEQGIRTYTCTACSDSYTEPVAALGHKWNNGTVTTEPTCTKKGIKTFTCTVCNANRYEDVVAIGHIFKIVNHEDGSLNYVYCERSKTETVNTSLYPQSEHNYANNANKTYNFSLENATKLVVKFSASTKVENLYDNIYLYDQSGTQVGKYTGTELANKTITFNGNGFSIKLVSDNENTFYGFSIDSIVATISLCDYRETQHTFGPDVVTKQPTCTEKGVLTNTCKTCGYVKTAEIAPNGHSFTDVVTKPTCTQKGFTTHTCTVCGHMFKDNYTDILPHSYKDEVTKPSCTQKGYTTHTCTVCGHTFEDSYTDLAPHTYVDVVTKPTCTEKGYTTHTCTVCGYNYKDTQTNALGHSYKRTMTKASVSANGKIVSTCVRCGQVQTDVIYYPKTITISKTSFNYNKKVQKPTVKVTGSNGKVVAASNYTVTYSKGCKNVGKYAVKVTFKGNYSGSKTFYYVIRPVVSPTNKALYIGQGVKIKTSASKACTFASANKKIATVDKKGTVMAKGAGTVKITVKCNGVANTVTIKVVKPCLILNKTSANIYIKGKLQLKATTKPGGQKVKWSSSNTKVATVTSKGVVVGVKAGTVKITAKFSYKGKNYGKTCTIKVVKKPGFGIGSTFKFGAIGGETIAWRVIDINGDDVFVISNKIIESKQLHPVEIDDITWSKSGIRIWLNSTFFSNAFTSKEQTMIKYSYLDNSEDYGQIENPDINTYDRIFLLSRSEFEKYIRNSKINSSIAAAEMTKYAFSNECEFYNLNPNEISPDPWWSLRTQGWTENTFVQINSRGEIMTWNGMYSNLPTGIRPAMRVSLKELKENKKI